MELTVDFPNFYWMTIFCYNETLNKIKKKLFPRDMCPDDTATAGSWAGIGLVN
jgi:hypothetical protein